MPYLELKIDGLDELIRGLEKLPEELEKELMASIESASEMVYNEAYSHAPEKTGEYKKSLKIVKPKLNKKGIMSGGVTFTNPKGVPLELGHRLVSHGKVVGIVKERPILRPAFDAKKEAAENEIIEGFNRAIDRMGGKR